MPLTINPPPAGVRWRVDPLKQQFHMVIARVVDGAMQIIGRLKQRASIWRTGWAQITNSAKTALRNVGLAVCRLLNAYKVSPFQRLYRRHPYVTSGANAADFLKRAEKVIP